MSDQELKAHLENQNLELKKTMRNAIVTYIGGLMLFFSTLLILVSINQFKKTESNTDNIHNLESRSSYLEYYTGKNCYELFKFNPYYKTRGAESEKGNKN